MALRRNDAAPRDVTIKSFREEFASHMEQRSSNAVSRIVPREFLRGEFVGHMVNYYEDDEKEFNSLIWRSSQMTRVVASDRNAILTLPVVLSFI